MPAGIRPSEGKVKEALFSIWSEELRDADFLDLFAGSGAVGIEAISRGATTATFVESDRRALALLQRNLALVPKGAARVVPGDVDATLAALAAGAARFALVFADPPYARIPDEELLRRCAAVLAPGGRIALEHAARAKPPAEAGDLVRIETRRYGESALSFYGST